LRLDQAAAPSSEPEMSTAPDRVRTDTLDALNANDVSCYFPSSDGIEKKKTKKANLPALNVNDALASLVFYLSREIAVDLSVTD
jgi:hypothetical protein